VAVLPHIPPGRSLTITLRRRVEGRYVYVVLPGINRQLTLCEVEVYGYRAPTGENLAFKGRATQSSIYANNMLWAAIQATDGNRMTNTHTFNDLNPWWRLDLAKTYRIFTVNVTNANGIYSARLNGAEIRIGDSLENNGNNNP
ncbi:hypothetical protein NL108_018647, partial [Boleophthalmus pectinirostris]